MGNEATTKTPLSQSQRGVTTWEVMPESASNENVKFLVEAREHERCQKHAWMIINLSPGDFNITGALDWHQHARTLYCNACMSPELADQTC